MTKLKFLKKLEGKSKVTIGCGALIIKGYGVQFELEEAPSEGNLKCSNYKTKNPALPIEEQEILLELRADCGLWSVPGGRMDPGETIEECVKREVKEETSLTVKVTKMIISNSFKVLSFEQKRQRVFYECKIVGKNKIILREGKKYRFISYNELKTLNVVPLDFAAINYHYLWKVKKFKHLP